MILHFVIWFLLCIYIIALRKQGRDFRKHCKQHKPVHIQNPETSFTIVVAFRNEAKNLPALIQSLVQLNYPANLVEVILVDDHSSDQSTSAVESSMAGFPFGWKLLHNHENETGKKAALKKGIANATHIYIAATDADCIIPPNWLLSLELVIQQQQAVFIGGPVLYTSTNSSILSAYQMVENAGLIVFGANGISGGYPFMANGANIAYAKHVFQEGPIFEGSAKLPGGDDEAALLKISEKYPDKLGFVYSPESIVKTPVQASWSNLLQQRIRWASKARVQQHYKVYITQICIALFFAGIWVAVVLALAANDALFAGITLGLKILADLYFYRYFRSFFGLQMPWYMVAISSLLQTLFIPVVAIGSLAGRFQWKGRSYRP